MLFLSKQRNRKTEITQSMDAAKNITQDTNKVFKSQKVITQQTFLVFQDVFKTS